MTTVLQQRILDEGPRTLDARLRAHFEKCRVRSMRHPETGRVETKIGWHGGHDVGDIQLFAYAYNLGTADAVGAIDPAAGLELTGAERARREEPRRAPTRKSNRSARRRLEELFTGTPPKRRDP